MKPVEEEEVIRHWLSGLDGDPDVESTSSRDKSLQDLQSRQRGPTSIFENYSIDWSYTQLSETEFRNLRIVKGPSDKDWRLLAPESNSQIPMLETVAKEVKSKTVNEIAEPIRDKVEKVRDLVEVVRKGDEFEPIIILQERNQKYPWIADGNHRAVAKYIYLLETGEYNGQEAYFGKESENSLIGRLL